MAFYFWTKRNRIKGLYYQSRCGVKKARQRKDQLREDLAGFYCLAALYIPVQKILGRSVLETLEAIDSNEDLAEGIGFEPTVRLPVLLISSQAP